VYEDPARHPWISAREQEYIVSSLAHQVRTNLLTTTDHAADTVAKGLLWGS